MYAIHFIKRLFNICQNPQVRHTAHMVQNIIITWTSVIAHETGDPVIGQA